MRRARRSFDEVACVVCGGGVVDTGVRRTTTAEYSAVRCVDCDLVMAVPRPSEAELTEFYRTEYFARGSDGCGDLGYADYGGLPAAAASLLFDQLTRWYPPVLGVAPKRLLDVGCATGDLMATARDNFGFDVVGVEASEDSAALATERHGLRVVTDLDHLDRDEPFGLVTMIHVVEHLADPAAALTKVARRLAPGGIVIFEIPQWNCLGRRVHGGQWAQFRPPEHLNFFTLPATRRLVERCGLRPVRMGTIQTGSVAQTVDALYRGQARRAARAGLSAFALSAFNLGSLLRVAAVADI